MKSNQWFIQTGFICKGNCEIIDLPIGVLPILKIGVPYQDGVPLLTQKVGTLFDVIVSNFKNGTTSKAIDVCRNFNYFLHKKPELMIQNMWSFKTDETIYHIPQTEIVRALFAVNKTMSNALFRPNGLDFLVNRVSMNKDQLATIDFSDEVPNSIMSDDFVRYFGWIFLHPEMKRSYSSVQSNLYGVLTKATNSRGIPIEVVIPKIFNFQLTVRGVIQNNEVLILEWIGSDIADPPFRELELHHKSIKKRIYSPEKRKKRVSNSNKEEEFELNENDGERSREDTNQMVIEADPTQMAFRHSPTVNRIANYEQKVNQGDDYISNIGQGGGTQQMTVAVDEAFFGGTIKPIELKTLEIADTYMNYGLEKFLVMLNCLNKRVKSVSVNFIFLPLGRKFSYLPDGRRRICAIAKIISGRKTNYILEVVLPDNRSLSTLIVSSSETLSEDESTIRNLLHNLVFASGSWSQSFLYKYKYERLKHLQESPEEWSTRIKRSLYK
ncbi:Tn7-like element transposition protein TnsE [Neobacillus sp. PS3-40]|uniref:Tn7-like element transposition protein TnsE n=1 Tax=Neobacillus sp. PS3-40 TaxID=3070679 RepID=UPI0027E134D0|nr:Tn7-like element transposition protein TnsE [Neobacillus sp. PS3-40]WML42639.1 Tn7-like element transposition protein TnsE [Neobacillus sp. PS3-40]